MREAIIFNLSNGSDSEFQREELANSREGNKLKIQMGQHKIRSRKRGDFQFSLVLSNE
jgi:hypothetical protein